MRWAVIMAGGNGTRFWPLSSPEHPKQFLRLLGERSPVEGCLSRVLRVVPMERVIIVASSWHRGALREVFPDFPEGQILWEPVGRNTAPCIAWALEVIRSRDPEAIVGVFPSDHAIPDEGAFACALDRAYAAARGRIVLFGMAPTRPETGYGYIEQGAEIAEGVHAVASFREKPDIDTARGYVRDGRFLWNSGMFIFDAATMHAELERWVPQVARVAVQLVERPDEIGALFPQFLSISIDYAVMEHTDRAAVIRGTFAWDDLGTWESVRRYFPSDASGNASCGTVRSLDCRRTFVYAVDGRTVATIGLDDIVVVSTPDAVLVMHSSRAQDVRGVADGE